MYLLCGCGALLFINSATLLLIDNAALLLISVKKEMLKLISGKKSIRDTSYLVLHFCSHSGSLKHWPVLEELLTRLQFLEIRIKVIATDGTDEQLSPLKGKQKDEAHLV